MTQWLSLWAVAFVLIGVRAFQQKNVMHERFLLIVPTSYAYAGLDMFVLFYGLQKFEAAPFATAFVLGTGAWMGCWAAIELHKRI